MANESAEVRQGPAINRQYDVTRLRRPGDVSFRARLRRRLGLGRSSSARRLLANITEFREEVERRIGEVGIPEAGLPPWAWSARRLLELADQALDRNDLTTGYGCLLAAQRAEIAGLPPAEIRAVAMTLHQEASSEKIGGWRGKAIIALLRDVTDKETDGVVEALSSILNDDQLINRISMILRENGQPDARKARLIEQLAEIGAGPTARERLTAVFEEFCATPSQLSAVAGLLHDHFRDASDHRARLIEARVVRDEALQNEYRKLERLQQQLFILGVSLAFIVAGLVAMFSIVDIPLNGGFSMRPSMLVSIALFGALGGSLTAILSVIKGGTAYSIPQLLIQGTVVLIRPFFGAAAALAVYTFLGAGLVTVASNSTAAVFSVSFVAGFSEQLITHSVGRLSPKVDETAQR